MNLVLEDDKKWFYSMWIDFCTFGNSKPFRIRIINRLNDNYDHFYIKISDASRVYGLELESLLSPNYFYYLIDGETLIEEQLSEKEFRFSTRLDVEYINDVYKLNIPEEDSYSTLGGFIVNHAKEIPQKGEVIEINNFQFIIEEASTKKIEQVKMIIDHSD